MRFRPHLCAACDRGRVYGLTTTARSLLVAVTTPTIMHMRVGERGGGRERWVYGKPHSQPRDTHI